MNIIEAVTASLKVLCKYATEIIGTLHVQLASAMQPTVIQNDSARASKRASGEGQESEHRAGDTNQNIELLTR